MIYSRNWWKSSVVETHKKNIIFFQQRRFLPSKRKKMSSQDVDVDISVVSSPEPSPRPEDHSTSRNEYQYSTQLQQQQQQQLQRHSAFNHSADSRLSPPKTPPEHHSKTSTGSAYTSFSITSILSRAEPKKGPITPMPTLPLTNDANGSVHDAAMISR